MSGDGPDEVALAWGGPIDGEELRVGEHVEEVVVVMADRTRHRYARVSQRSRPVVMRWVGRV